MRIRSAATPLLATLASAFVLSGCASSPSPQEEVVVTQPAAVVTTETAVVTVPTEIATIHPALITAWSGSDPNAFQVYFTDNATVVTPVRTFTGWTEIHSGYLTPMFPGVTSYTLTPASFTREGMDVIVESGNFAYKITKEGALTDVTGTYTHRWQKQPDGSWRLVSVTIK